MLVRACEAGPLLVDAVLCVWELGVRLCVRLCVRLGMHLGMRVRVRALFANGPTCACSRRAYAVPKGKEREKRKKKKKKEKGVEIDKEV